MLEIACRQIREEQDAFERRRHAERQRAAVMSALDDVLAELEELSLAESRVAPTALRERVARVVARAFELHSTPTVPRSVLRLMDVVFAAQEAALLRQRQAIPDTGQR